MRRIPLDSLLRAIALSVSPIVVLSACSSSDGQPEDLGETAVCPDLAGVARYQALTLGAGVSGIEFRTIALSPDSQASSAPTTLGTPCAGASSSCVASAAEATSDTGWSVPVVQRFANEGGSTATDYGVVTRSDNVQVVTTLGDLSAAILPIDSMAEAITWLRLTGNTVDCDAGNAQTTSDGWVFRFVAYSCSGEETQYKTLVSRDGGIKVIDQVELAKANNNCIEGRRPLGYIATENDWLASLSAHFSEIANLEAASVLAFADLARDLTRIGAPASFVARAELARLDEIDHAARMTALAERFGARPSPPRVERVADPTFFALARANAVEGCVRETYGALVARYQSIHASDPAIRAAFERIAADEAAHATLSHDLAAWFESKLSAIEVESIRAAETEVIAELAQAIQADVSEPVARIAGMPTPAAARELLRGLRLALFAPAHRAA